METPGAAKSERVVINGTNSADENAADADKNGEAIPAAADVSAGMSGGDQEHDEKKESREQREQEDASSVPIDSVVSTLGHGHDVSVLSLDTATINDAVMMGSENTKSHNNIKEEPASSSSASGVLQQQPRHRSVDPLTPSSRRCQVVIRCSNDLDDNAADDNNVSMPDVGFMMREQDAELLESLHVGGPNNAGVTTTPSPGAHHHRRSHHQQSSALSGDGGGVGAAVRDDPLMMPLPSQIQPEGASAPLMPQVGEPSNVSSMGTEQQQQRPGLSQQLQRTNLSPVKGPGVAEAAELMMVGDLNDEHQKKKADGDSAKTASISAAAAATDKNESSPETKINVDADGSLGGSNGIKIPQTPGVVKRALSGDVWVQADDGEDESSGNDEHEEGEELVASASAVADATPSPHAEPSQDTKNQEQQNIQLQQQPKKKKTPQQQPKVVVRTAEEENEVEDEEQKQKQQKQQLQQKAGSDSLLQRTCSMDRRMSEVAQFLEAVGDADAQSQNGLEIVDEDVDDEDDDHDEEEDSPATEIHVDRSQQIITVVTPASSKRVITVGVAGDTDHCSVAVEEDAGSVHHVTVDEAVRPNKKRPQWPFQQNQQRAAAAASAASRDSNGNIVIPVPGFLHALPDSSGGQDFEYKGIQANPPEIVKRGTARGNYALLHRKAWLEVSDKYHRYGKHLRLYYRYWERLGFPTNSFFEWLDSKGEAAGQPLPHLDECPRSQLDSDTVLYIANPDVTNGYALHFEPDSKGRGKIIDVDGDCVRTGPDGWIFVIRDNVLYGAPKITSVTGHSKQRFHHSSFFGGKAVAAAGIFMTDDDGFLTRVLPHSGHYRPGEPHVQRMLFFLHHQGVDLRTFGMDTQQIVHVSREMDVPIRPQSKTPGADGAAAVKTEKKKKVESLHMMNAVLVACFLAHKARFIGEGVFAQIHQIRKVGAKSVTEALELIDDGGCW